MSNLDLSTQLDVLTRELDEGQRMIDHARKTRFGRLSPVRAYLNRRQFILDTQRIKVEAAKKHLANQNQ